MIGKVPIGHLTVTPGTKIDVLAAIESAVDEGLQTNCIPINVTKYGLSRRDPQLRNAINNAQLVVADGMPICWLTRLLGLPTVARITGIEFAESILETAAKKGWRVYFFGASPDSLSGAVQHQSRRNLGLNIVGSRHGYYETDELPAIVGEINALQADVVLVGLGLPQKEYFIAHHAPQLNSRLNIAVGGAFDVWSGAKKRAPRLVQQIGLEWAYRSLTNYRKATTLARHATVFLWDASAAVLRSVRIVRRAST